MTMTRKIGITCLLGIFLTIAVLGFSSGKAKASTVALPNYTFKISAQKITDGSEYELKTPNTYVSAVADGWAAPSTVDWFTSNSDVVAIESTTNANMVNIIRKGPGYSTITANITQGGYSYSISFVVKVDLQIDYATTGTTYATTTSSRVLVLDSSKTKGKIYLKYTDYTPDDKTSAVSGSAISSNAVTFDSDNKGVATVDSDGWVTAVGGGSTNITITSKTMSSKEKPMIIDLTVVVAPTFQITYTDSSKVTHTCDSKMPDSDPHAVYDKLPSSFIIQSNATLGDNLTWVVYNDTGTDRTTIAAGKTAKMTYVVNDNGTVTFSGIKAGTYEIYAFADKSYTVKTNVPYAYMKIYVPINIGDQDIVMSVGDTYSILDNSNIPSANIFIAPANHLNDIADLDPSTFIITAKRQGSVTFELNYDTGQKILEGSTVPKMYITVTVIDGIALSTAKATLYTKGTLQLEAIATDNTAAITWSSNNPGVATVSDGLITGLKAGTATITASQTINGVVKSASCDITVQPSVTSITVDPATASLPIGGYKTLHATIAPTNLSGVTLQWKSSNESVVKIVESSALTATIQGVAGGHAVISAINQDNVVVGYCHVDIQQSVTGITLSETSSIVGLSMKNLQLRATVTPDNALNKTVNWSSTDTTKASVNANGLVTFLKPGTVTIVATSADNPSAVAYCNLTIQVPAVSISLDETVKTMYVGQSARLAYVVLPANASNNAVVWTSTNTSVATVDAGGLVSAKSVGTTVIMLKTLDGGYSTYCTLTVKQVATAIKFDVKDLALKTGEYYYIKATLTPKDSTDNGLTWESSDTKVAIVDDSGKVTGKNAGTAVIMARTQAGGVAYCKVTVTQPVNGLVLNFTEKTIYKGEKFELVVSVSPGTATKLDVTYKSSNTKVATVTKSGEVSGLIGGVSIISCTTVDGGYTAACVVTVRETVTTVKLNHSSYKLGIRKKVMLTATVATETATNQKVKWTSSNRRVAVVNQKGKVTGLAIGYATITATALDGSDVDASCDIRVVNPVTSISISRATLSLYIGESKKLSAAVRPKKATYKKARWVSADESIAMVDDSGVVIAVKPGSTTVTAKALDSSNAKAVCYVTVHDRVAATGVTLQDKTLTMVPGEQKMVNVVLIPAASTDAKKWSTDNAAVASIDKNTGKITARSTGVAYITVMTDSGKTATVEVTVIGLNISKLVTEEYTTYNTALSVEGTSSAVSWRSDNPMVAIVYSDGTVSTRGAGTATITATVNGRRLQCKVVVRSM